MRFVSTAGKAPSASLREALLGGLAPDGGLYMPGALPTLSPGKLDSLRNQSWSYVAEAAATALLGSHEPSGMPPEVLSRITREALDFPIPLHPLSPRVSILELFHGPTLAFKDVGARYMARMVGHHRGGQGPRLTVLTATSGDTGGAVAHAFLGLEGVRVVVLFPDGKVTPRQERQFSTLGRNVLAVAVQGDFDDCQRLAKEAFRDAELLEEVNLTSANSINVGRLLPQTFYYFHAWAQTTSRESGEDVLFSVPSGNFGNLAAGLMAKAMGLPGAHFLAATNANDGVPAYLRSGRFTPRPSIPTLSTAMDVGDPSNLARILHLYGEDLPRLRSDLVGRVVDDAETRLTIRQVFDETGYVLDPHSAVGYAALVRELEARPRSRGILLATAHAAKFAEVVEPVLGETVPIPPALARCMEGKREVTSLVPELGELRALLLGS